MPTILIQVGIALALTAAEVGIQALLGGNREYGTRLLNRSYSSSTYGADIWRCRGTVRVPGNLVWSTIIQETLYDRQTSKKSDLYTYWYSCSLAIGFAHGPLHGADSWLTLWTDGKRLYSAKVSNAKITGTVTLLASSAQPALQSDLVINVRTEGGSTLFLEAGAIFNWPGDDTDYEVLESVTLGPNQYGQIQIWPPLFTSKTQNAAMQVPGSTGNTIDSTDFTVPNEAGVYSSGGPRFKGAQSPTFYLGTAGQLPDPVLQEYLGADNVPGYRNLVYCVLDQLQLANFGNHIPNFTAEIAFDGTTAQFPTVGPVPGANATQLAIPSQVSAAQSPGNASTPWVVGLSANQHVAVINSFSMTTQSTFSLDSPTVYPVLADTDGYLYAFFSTGTGMSTVVTLTKWDILGSAMVDSVVVSGFFTAPYGGVPCSVTLFDWYDPFPTLAGGHAPELRKFIGIVGSHGGTLVIDRAASWSGAAALFYDWWTGASPANAASDADGNGGFWVAYGSTLFSNQIDSSPNPASASMDVVTMVTTSIDIGDITAVIGAVGSVRYRSYDNVLVFFGDSGLGVYSIAIGLMGALAQFGGSTPLGPIDGLGTVLCDNGGSVVRVSTASIQYFGQQDQAAPEPRTYAVSNWVATGATASAGGSTTYNAATNSLWVTSATQSTFQIFLDRSAGASAGIDDIISWLCSQTDLDPSQYDTSAITGLYAIDGIQFGHEAPRDSILKLMDVFQIDAYESDGAIRFVPRNRPPNFYIEEDDIGALESITQTEARIEEVLITETDMPERISLLYFDTARNGQQALQYSKRISLPFGTPGVGYPTVTHTRLEKVVTTSITSDATTMKRQTEKMLYEAWASRFSYSFKTTLRFLMLDPSDIIGVNYKGLSLEMRIVSVDRGAGLAVQIKTISHDHLVYSSIAVSQAGGMEPSS